MTSGVVNASTSGVRGLRNVLAALGVAVWVVMLVPPFLTWSTRYEFVQAIQYCVFGVVAPALLATGSPWRVLKLVSGEDHVIDPDGSLVSPQRPRVVDRWALRRSTHSGQRRAITSAFIFSLLAVFWRLAPLADALAQHSWLVVVESLSLVVSGLALWVDLVESPPLTPGATRPYRIGIATGTMWVIWVTAYLYGQSHDNWYHAFHYLAGSGISQSADQQLSAGVMWALTAGSFLPVVFWNLVHWLQSEEDPSEELYRLVRQEKVIGPFGEDHSI